MRKYVVAICINRSLTLTFFLCSAEISHDIPCKLISHLKYSVLPSFLKILKLNVTLYLDFVYFFKIEVVLQKYFKLVLYMYLGFSKYRLRDHSGYVLSQWEVMLQCNVVSHWLNLYPEWSWDLPYMYPANQWPLLQKPYNTLQISFYCQR